MCVAAGDVAAVSVDCARGYAVSAVGGCAGEPKKQSKDYIAGGYGIRAGCTRQFAGMAGRRGW
jgi:hypothetical protein